MSLANGFSRMEGTTGTLLRRCLANVGTALSLLARPARIRRSNAYSLPTLPTLAVAGGIAIVAFLFLAWAIDGAASRGAGRLPQWIVGLFHDITDFGQSGWFLWPLGLLFLALAALPPVLTPISQRVLAVVMVRVGFLFTAIAVPGLFVSIVKRIIGRARPNVGGSLDPFLFDPFKWIPAYAGMPSGHATTAFAVLVAFGSLWPRARTALLIYAVLIGISRVVVTAHYPTDILAGAMVGAVGAMMVRRYFALRRLGFSIGPGGEVRQLPGPSLRRIKAVARGLLGP